MKRDAARPRPAQTRVTTFTTLLLLLLPSLSPPASACDIDEGQFTCPAAGSRTICFEEPGGSSPFQQICPSAGFRCVKPRDGQPSVQVVQAGCDPQVQPCTIVLRVPFELPGNVQNIAESGLPGFYVVYWYGSSVANKSCNGTGGCGEVAVCGRFASHEIRGDFIETWLRIGGVSCSNLTSPLLHAYSLAAYACPTNSTCRKVTYVQGLDLSPFAVGLQLGCFSPPPPKKDGCNTQVCNSCLGGASVGGGGAAFDGEREELPLGPGASFRYTAGGVGALAQPGSSALNRELGRFWIHTYSERIAVDPDPGHVWLLSQNASFVEFTDSDSDGTYEEVSPSDDYRTLTYNAATGWSLTELDGMVHAFNLQGRWASTTDRFGNATTGAYDVGGQLISVTKPDGRSESFAYNSSGTLVSITELGVGGAGSRIWLYDWDGLDLFQVVRPDDTRIELFYEDNRFPGYLSRIELVGQLPPPPMAQVRPRRVLRAFEYDADGNVIKTWRGATTFASASAVDKWQLSFDDPAMPATTTVTDPLGQVITYTVGRDVGSEKPRVEAIEGDCPVCDSGPNSQYVFGDPAHPLLPTQETDGEGNVTLYAYDENGRMTSKTEALGTPLERLTEWEYDATFPALVTLERRPSTSGLPSTYRETTFGYNSEGAMTSRTETGLEDGQPFTYVTTYTPNAAGQPETLDPPGYGTADQVSFTYDAARGNLIPLTRTDPLIGTTTYGYDGYNRRTGATDPNGVATTTAYDAMNRVTEVRQLGATPPTDDLVTRFVYNFFGDLDCQIFPRGNGQRIQYDSAGRVSDIRRGTAVASPSTTACLDNALARERTLYTLNGAGQRTNEKQDRSTSSTAWATDLETTYVYGTRCHLDQVIQAPGRPEEATTEYAYDCNGRLKRTWDANHPSSNQTAAATTIYEYDELDRLISVEQPWEAGDPAVTTYAYDVQDHLTTVTDAEGNTTTYTYSDRDLMTGETSPVSGTTTRTYNEHGQPLVETDARGIVTTRTHDALDRVTLIDVPTASQDTTFVYDDPLVPFSKGRLTSVTRGSEVVSYSYDRFGRTLQDGALSYSWDANGNRSTIVYPGQVTATYGYDFLDRPRTLSVLLSDGTTVQNLVTAAGYRAAGPLSSLTLANGYSETRTFDFRYVPDRITLKVGATTRLDWDYTTDDVGNITFIENVLTPSLSRTYAYRDVQYFLTQGDGPWGGSTIQTRAWTYDKIGNRLSETRDGATDTYQYVQNGTGNTPILQSVQLSTLGTRAYTYGPAGHLELVNAAGNLINFDNDSTGQLSRLERSAASAQVNMTYDGRGFLALASEPSTEGNAPDVIPSHGEGSLLFADGFESGDICAWSSYVGIVIPDPSCPKPPPPSFVHATYSSDGLLHALARSEAPADILYFYFSGRPVAQLEIDGEDETFKWITTDHLGTPVALTDTTTTPLWRGGFEPFGADFGGASAQNLFLRFPGQWSEGTWDEAGSGEVVEATWDRWYLGLTGRFSAAQANLYYYAGSVSGEMMTAPIADTPAIGWERAEAAPLASRRYDLSEIQASSLAKTVCDGCGGLKWVWIGTDRPVCGEACFIKHEEDHIAWFQKHRPDSCKGRAEGANPLQQPGDKAKTECSAYGVSAPCLELERRKALAQRMSQACQAYLNANAAGHKARREEYCSGDP